MPPKCQPCVLRELQTFPRESEQGRVRLGSRKAGEESAAPGQGQEGSLGPPASAYPHEPRTQGKSPNSRAGSQGLNPIPAPHSPGTGEPFSPPVSPSSRVLPSLPRTSGTTMPFPVRAPCSVRYALRCRDRAELRPSPRTYWYLLPHFRGALQVFGAPGRCRRHQSRAHAIPRELVSKTPGKQAGKGSFRGQAEAKGAARALGFVFMFTHLVSFKGKGEHPNKEEKENPSGLIWIPGKLP